MGDSNVRIGGCGCLLVPLVVAPLALVALGGWDFYDLDAQGMARFALKWGCMAPLGLTGALVACAVLFLHD